MEAALVRILGNGKTHVSSVAFSPDGSLLAGGGGHRDNAARLWDTKTWEVKHILRGHKRRPKVAAFSVDGRTLATIGPDKTIGLWDTRSGEMKSMLAGHKGVTSSVAFSPNGKLLATAGHDGSLFLRNATTGDVLHSLTGHHGYVISAAFSPDGGTLASAGGLERQVAEVRLWDTETGRPVRVFGGHSDWVLWTSFSPDGRTLGSGTYGEVMLTDVASGSVRTIRKTEWSMVAFAFSPDGRLLATGGWTFPPGEDGTPDYRQAIGGIQLWGVDTGRPELSFKAHDEQVTSISYSPDGRMLASGSADGTIRLWDVGTISRYPTLP